MANNNVPAPLATTPVAPCGGVDGEDAPVQAAPEVVSVDNAAAVDLLPCQPHCLKRKLVSSWTQDFNFLRDLLDGGPTHQCKLCGWTVSLPRNAITKSFINSKAVRHMKRVHQQSTIAKRARHTEKKKVLKAANTIFDSFAKTSANGTTALLQNFRAAQAEWFIHSRMRVPKSGLDDAYFKKMLRAGIIYGRHGGSSLATNSSTSPYLTGRMTPRFVEAERDLFRGYFRLYLKDVRKSCGGNRFAQGMHDGVTLANSNKYFAFGLQIPDLDAGKNWMVCLDFRPATAGSTAEATKILLLDTFEKLTGFDYRVIVFDTIADGAALKVAELVGHLRRICAMHEGDKIGRASSGDLVRSRRHVVANEFRAGSALMAAAQKVAVHFSYGERRDKLKQVGSTLPGGAPDIVPQTGICTTRIAARANMLRSLLRLKKAIVAYCNSRSTAPSLSEDQWNQVRDVEGVMTIVSMYTTVVQTEQHFMRAMGVVAKVELLNALRRGSVSVIDCEKVTAVNTEPRKDLSGSDLTDVGRECRERAQLEAERRFCGHKKEVLHGTILPVINIKDKVSLLLDPRTFHWALNFIKPTTGDREAVLACLQESYVEFGVQFESFFAPQNAPRDSDDNSGSVEASRRSSSTNLEDEIFSFRQNSSDEEPDDEAEAQRARFQAEFKVSWSYWIGKMYKLNWCNLWPAGELQQKIPLNPLKLREAPVHKLLRAMRRNPKRRYGYLPLMATHSDVGIGILAAASYCERINSQANHILKEDNTQLAPEMISGLVSMRMNNEFFQFLRNRYAHLSKEAVLAEATSSTSEVVVRDRRALSVV